MAEAPRPFLCLVGRESSMIMGSSHGLEVSEDCFLIIGSMSYKTDVPVTFK